jgi:hypothetical protein
MTMEQTTANKQSRNCQSLSHDHLHRHAPHTCLPDCTAPQTFLLIYSWSTEGCGLPLFNLWIIKKKLWHPCLDEEQEKTDLFIFLTAGLADHHTTRHLDTDSRAEASHRCLLELLSLSHCNSQTSLAPWICLKLQPIPLYHGLRELTVFLWSPLSIANFHSLAPLMNSILPPSSQWLCCPD